jgi:hypothetical protein
MKYRDKKTFCPESMRSEAPPEPYQNRIKTPSVEAVELAD